VFRHFCFVYASKRPHLGIEDHRVDMVVQCSQKDQVLVTRLLFAHAATTVDGTCYAIGVEDGRRVTDRLAGRLPSGQVT